MFVIFVGAPSVQMHPVPPDWALKGAPNPQETEDEKPDEKTPAMTKEGATKVDNEKEFFQDEKDNDNINEKDEEKKKRKLNNDNSDNNRNNDNSNSNSNDKKNDKNEKNINEEMEKLPEKELSSASTISDLKVGELIEEIIGMEVVEEVVIEVVSKELEISPR